MLRGIINNPIVCDAVYVESSRIRGLIIGRIEPSGDQLGAIDRYGLRQLPGEHQIDLLQVYRPIRSVRGRTTRTFRHLRTGPSSCHSPHRLPPPRPPRPWVLMASGLMESASIMPRTATRIIISACGIETLTIGNIQRN